MATKQQAERQWLRISAPITVTKVTGASGTYQASASNYGKIHEIICMAKTMHWLRGTGSSVTVTTSTGHPVPAATAKLFIPAAGRESVGFVTSDAASTDFFISVISDA